MEVQRKSAGQASPASPTLFCFKVTSLDFDRTWTRLTAEFGQVCRIPLEVQQTVHWVRRNWLGPVKVHWNPLEKGGECKVHHMGTNEEGCEEEGRGWDDAMGVGKGTRGKDGPEWQCQPWGVHGWRWQETWEVAGYPWHWRGAVCNPHAAPVKLSYSPNDEVARISHAASFIPPPLSPTVMTMGRCGTHTPPFVLLHLPLNKRGAFFFFSGVYSRGGMKPTCCPDLSLRLSPLIMGGSVA